MIWSLFPLLPARRMSGSMLSRNGDGASSSITCRCTCSPPTWTSVWPWRQPLPPCLQCRCLQMRMETGKAASPWILSGGRIKAHEEDSKYWRLKKPENFSDRVTESSTFYIWCMKRNAPRQANARERQDVPLRSGCSSVWRRSCEFSYCRGDLGKTSKRVNITNPSVLSGAVGLTSGGEDLSLIGWSCGSLHKWWGIPSVTFRLIVRGGFKSKFRCPLILNHSALFLYPNNGTGDVLSPDRPL